MVLKKFGYVLGAVLLGLTIQPAIAQDITIRFSNWVPTTHWLSKWYVEYTKEIERVTEGRVKVEVLPKVVGTPQSQFEVVTEGLADMAFFIPGYTPGRFRLAEMGELPLTGDDMSVVAPAFNDIYMKYFLQYDEFKGTKLLGVFSNSPMHLATVNRQVKNLDDLKGLKLRSPNGTITRLFELAGVVPVLKSATEAYELLSTGAIDGSAMIPEGMLGSNAVDLMRYFNLVPGGFANSMTAVVMNADVWNSIPPEDQKLIESVSGASVATLIARAYAEQNGKAFDAMKAADYVIEPLAPEAIEAFRVLSKPVDEVWIEDAKAKGVEDPAKILEELRAVSAK